MSKYVDDNDAPYTGTITMDGYTVDERILEGVIFEADVVAGVLDEDSVRVSANDSDYFKKNGTKKQMADVLRHFREYDIFNGINPDANVGREDDTGTSTASAPMPLKASSIDDMLNRLDDMIDVEEDEDEEVEEKVDPATQKYQIRVTVQRADLLQNPDQAEQFLGFDEEEKVKETLQSINGAKSMVGDIDVVITDRDGNTYNPWDFGLPKQSQYENRIAQKVGKVVEGEGYREVFEDLLEFMCVKPYETWDIIEALDEVFDEDDGPDMPEDDGKFSTEIGIAIGLVNQDKGTSREAFENLLELMISKRWKSWDIAEALDEVYGEWELDVATADKAVYDMKDEKTVKAVEDNKISKEDFMEGLLAGKLGKGE